MTLVVQKYRGSSLAGPAMIGRAARRIGATRRAGHDVVVVASAMGATNHDLIRLAGQVARTPPERELDLLLSSGERVSSALLAMAIHELGAPACSLSGQQAGMITTSTYRDARIVHVSPFRVRHEVFDLGRARVARAAAAGGVE